MNTIIIEPNTKVDYQLFVNLAKRLNVKYREEKTEKEKDKKKKNEELFFSLAGSLDLPESSEELINIIESSRTSKDIDISWAE